MTELDFTIYMRAEPQGSTKAFVIPGTNRAIITSANVKMKPFRSELTRMARATVAAGDCAEPMFGKHVPVSVEANFIFQRPPSAPKSRAFPVVKPDLDKLLRAVLDSLTGVAFVDDAQVVRATPAKDYGPIDQVQVIVRGM